MNSYAVVSTLTVLCLGSSMLIVGKSVMNTIYILFNKPIFCKGKHQIVTTLAVRRHRISLLCQTVIVTIPRMWMNACLATCNAFKDIVLSYKPPRHNKSSSYIYIHRNRQVHLSHPKYSGHVACVCSFHKPDEGTCANFIVFSEPLSRNMNNTGYSGIWYNYYQ